MREIKFQAWLRDEKQMVNVIKINTFDKYIQYYDISHCKDDAEIFDFIRSNLPNADCGFEGCDLRQYTGLKDKNGKEIYEGDIVVAWSEGCSGKFEVRWRQESAPKWILYPAWQSQKFWNLHGTKCEDGYYYDMVEVIGNIYEHQHLLEDKKAVNAHASN